MRLTLLLLVSAVVLSPPVARADEGTKDLEYRFQGGFGYLATVARLGETTCEIRELGYFYPEEEEPQEVGEVDFVEGFYLALAAPSSTEIGVDAKSHVLRVEVEEILSKSTARLRIDESAARLLKPGWTLRFHRPTGVTTKRMREMPGLATLVDSGEKVTGLDDASSTALGESRDNLKQIGLALHNHLDARATLPPAVVLGPDGKPWHSWRVLILPYLGEEELFARYRLSEPWNSPHNLKLVPLVPDFYRDPIHGETSDGYTHYAAVTGGRAVMGEGRFSPAAVKAKRFSVGELEGGRRFQSVVDGTANTICVGPVSPARKIPWTKPEDVPLAEAGRSPAGEKGFAWPYTSRLTGRGGPFLFLDGSVQLLPAEIDADSFGALLTVDGAEVVGELPSFVSFDEEDEFERITVIMFERTDDGYRAVQAFELPEE